MKITTAALTTIIALLGVGIDSVSAACYDSGAVWGDRVAARYHVERACRGYDGKRRAFQGVYKPGETKSACVESGLGKYNFRVQNLNRGASFDLRDADCVLRLHNVINDCERGGQSEVAGWRFR